MESNIISDEKSRIDEEINVFVKGVLASVGLQVLDGGDDIFGIKNIITDNRIPVCLDVIRVNVDVKAGYVASNVNGKVKVVYKGLSIGRHLYFYQNEVLRKSNRIERNKNKNGQMATVTKKYVNNIRQTYKKSSRTNKQSELEYQ